jgi:glutaminase
MSTFIGSDSFIKSHFEQQRSGINKIIQELDSDGKGYVTINDLRQGMRKQGLDPLNHPEIKMVERSLVHKVEERLGSPLQPKDIPFAKIEFEDMYALLGDKDNVNIVQRALSNQLAVPDWEIFCREMTELFESVREVTDGHVATYIPQLAAQDPEWFGLSICTVDGQRFSIGDCHVDFTIQSCSKVFTYCIACEELGSEKVHEHIGFEPSGVAFNAFQLDDSRKPHNPMINAGAITTCSLIANNLSASHRFTHVVSKFSDFAGGARIGFDNATFLSEKDTADRNFALAYYMQENQVFPKTKNQIEDTLDLYFQLCSVLVDTESLAAMSATLANGGICPVTNKNTMSSQTVKNVLQLMLGCGMYDYSGEWSCTCGLPAKSGVAGALSVVIPSVMGIALFSPRLDARGNSVRGVEFCKRASVKYGWNIFDQLLMNIKHDDDEEEEEQQQEEQQILVDPITNSTRLPIDGETYLSSKHTPISTPTHTHFSGFTHSNGRTSSLEDSDSEYTDSHKRKRTISESQHMSPPTKKFKEHL